MAKITFNANNVLKIILGKTRFKNNSRLIMFLKNVLENNDFKSKIYANEILKYFLGESYFSK